MKIFSVVNHKGGVAKTTTTANLGAVLAEKHSVLMVDLDPQAGLTSSFKINPPNGSPNTYTCFLGKHNFLEAAQETKVNNLCLVPSTLDLAAVELELLGQIGFERKLKLLSQGLSDKFDFLFVDCPPSLGILTVNAIVAADHLIIPLQCEYLAMKALAQLKNIIQKAKSVNPDLKQKILFTMFMKRTLHSKEVVEEVRGFFPTYKTVITRTVKFAYSTVEGVPLVKASPNSEQAQQYKKLAKEIQNEQSIRSRPRG